MASVFTDASLPPSFSSSSYANALWKDVDSLMNLIIPSQQSNELRDAIAHFLRKIIRKSLELKRSTVAVESSRQHSCFDGDSCGDDEDTTSSVCDWKEQILLLTSGSCCSKTYLPDGDIDLVLITKSLSELSGLGEMTDLTETFSALCEEIYRKEHLQQPYLYPQFSSIRPDSSSDLEEFSIRNIEFINARTKLLHCMVDSYSVDISLNQIGIIASMLFIEEVDREIGDDHLFKRSILLIKCWCLHESRLYCGTPVLGSKEGMLSSYAISVMIMHLFNVNQDLNHPLQVLQFFLNYYQRFPWESHVLTLEGPQPIQWGGSNASVATNSSNGNTIKESYNGNSIPSVSNMKYGRCSNRFYPMLERLGKTIQEIAPTVNENLIQKKKLVNPSLRFALRMCNIQDPVDDTNNLGYSVSRNSLALIDRAFQVGASRLNSLLAPTIPGLSPLQPTSHYHQQSLAPHSTSNANMGASSVPSTPTYQARMSPSVNPNTSGNGSFLLPTPFFPFPPVQSSASNPSRPSTTAGVNSQSFGESNGVNQNGIVSLDSFFAMSLQYYTLNQVTSVEAARKKSFASSVTTVFTSANDASLATKTPNDFGKCSSSESVADMESSSLPEDPLAMNKKLLLDWLKRAEKKALEATHMPRRRDSSTSWKQQRKDQVVSSEVDSRSTTISNQIGPDEIKPINVSSPFPQPSASIRFSSPAQGDGLIQIDHSAVRARSPSPSSTCSSLSSAITTAADSVDHSPGHLHENDFHNSNQLTHLQLLRRDSLSSTEVMDEVPRFNGLLSKSPSPDSSEGTSRDGYSNSSLLASVLGVPDCEQTVPPVNSEIVNQKNDGIPRNANVSGKHSQKKLKKQPQKKNPSAPSNIINISSVTFGSRGRSDSVRSQISDLSNLSREERGENSFSSFSSEEAQSVSFASQIAMYCQSMHVYLRSRVLSLKCSWDLNGSRNNTKPAVVAAAQRRQLQQRKGHTAVLPSTFAIWQNEIALTVAVLLLTGVVFLSYSSPSPVRLTQPRAVATSIPNVNTGSLDRVGLLNTLSKDPVSTISRLFNQSPSISDSVLSSSENTTNVLDSVASTLRVVSQNETDANISDAETKQHKTEYKSSIIDTVSSSVATHWVQVGDSLIFGSDHQHQFSSFTPTATMTLSVTGESVASSLRGSANPTASSVSGIHNDDKHKEGQLFYLWTKDDLPVSVSSQPLLSISQTVLSDSGHYRCYAFAPFTQEGGIRASEIQSQLWQALVVFSVVLATDMTASSASNAPAPQQQQQQLLQQRLYLQQLAASLPGESGEGEMMTAEREKEYWMQWLKYVPTTAAVFTVGHIARFSQLLDSAATGKQAHLHQIRESFPWKERKLQDVFSQPLMLNHLGSSDTSAFALVTETRISISKKPRIRNRPFYQEIKAGKPFYLPLEVEAVPTASFQWFKNGYPLPDQRQSVLLLESVDVSSTGTYSCEVVNVAGKLLWLEATIHVVD
jgi:hypothetical protein